MWERGTLVWENDGLSWEDRGLAWELVIEQPDVGGDLVKVRADRARTAYVMADRGRMVVVRSSRRVF